MTGTPSMSRLQLPPMDPGFDYDGRAPGGGRSYGYGYGPPSPSPSTSPPLAGMADDDAGSDEGCAPKLCLCPQAARVPRPRNAFILYRQHRHATVVAENPGKTNPEISKIIGEQWRQLSVDDKAVWQKLGDEEKRTHLERFPNYRYQPRRNHRRGDPAAAPTVCPRCRGHAPARGAPVSPAARPRDEPLPGVAALAAAPPLGSPAFPPMLPPVRGEWLREPMRDPLRDVLREPLREPRREPLLEPLREPLRERRESLREPRDGVLLPPLQIRKDDAAQGVEALLSLSHVDGGNKRQRGDQPDGGVLPRVDQIRLDSSEPDVAPLMAALELVAEFARPLARPGPRGAVIAVDGHPAVVDHVLRELVRRIGSLSTVRTRAESPPVPAGPDAFALDRLEEAVHVHRAMGQVSALVRGGTSVLLNRYVFSLASDALSSSVSALSSLVGYGRSPEIKSEPVSPQARARSASTGALLVRKRKGPPVDPWYWTASLYRGVIAPDLVISFCAQLKDSICRTLSSGEKVLLVPGVEAINTIETAVRTVISEIRRG
ncbi:uncharacterized protein V1510DRAFT_430796 [Dipodascopsis tothii]|uniref:uncharacterized protein n=1 Tax=Dipodascopsis tothii TaxID=44089 RepID=UPI0034CE5A9B